MVSSAATYNVDNVADLTNTLERLHLDGQDWMVDACDIRRDDRYARLRDGKVDIGCYQCWLEPAGTLLLLR